MDTLQLEKLKYPIGKFEAPQLISEDHLSLWFKKLKTLPSRVDLAVQKLNESQLDTPYRPEGWTVREVVHHLADSHHNAYTRFKWALTEDQPTIKAYDENAWAKGIDYKAPISLSLNYLAALHEKLIYLLENLEQSDITKSFIHPATGEKVVLKNMVGMYAWHGDHHLAQIMSLMEREGWG
ncbi:YfiT family bacillithiol transferase [Flavimarina sp. Hel_I_48]|uniref:YfiT family bacillithiol transferase n=1 Tax=Flavimarina sp. Hel_I_48 TaxID=1392488 RepID=UPI0004DEE740|nr:putative metal-dependent hydrolase [Flavimarina sp. Hel_I_48]